MASHYLQPRRHLQLRDFHHRTKMLLTEMERHHLFAVVKEFQSARHLDKFLRDLTYVLDTPTKLDLLKDIRHFIPASLAIQYDQLAPYDRMAHPLKMSTKSLGRYGGKNLPSVSMQSSPASVRHPLGMTDAPAGDLVPLKVITLVKDTDEQLGFSIRGGSEYGLGIFISDIEEYSAAEHAGLRMGDNVIEVNSVSFENIASSSAVKVLIGCSRLRILVRRVGKVPGFKSAKEKTSWFDVIQNRIVTGMLEEHGKFNSTAAIAHAEGHINRRINLTCRREGEYLGFNIRGGREYALGIYVSGVDPDGIAEQKGLKVGDQIIAVNGHSFEEATHMEAVEIMKSDKQLVMTVRDVGIYPIYKEIYAEYRWIDVVTGAVTKSRTYQRQNFGGTTGHITSVPVTEHTPWTPPDTVNGFMTEQMSSFMGSDDIDTVNISDDDDNMFNESDSMELFDQRQQPNAAVQTDDYACIDTVLQPVKDDVIMQERYLDISGESKDAKPSIVTKSKSPKSTIAVRAMENETRRSHPELASLWENGRVCDSASSEKSPAVVKKTGRKPRTIRELIFGTKSKGTSGKSATEGAHRKPRSRKALSGINFRLGSSKDTDSSGIEEDSGISQGTETESTQQTDSARMEALKHSATQLLNSDEVSAVLRHIHTYKEAGDVDGLVSPLTAILDTSHKATLFDGIKMILSAKDIRHFDSLVARHLSSLSSGHRTSPAETEAIRTERRHDVSNELCRINRKCLLSPVDARNHGNLGTATDNPCYTRRNSKLYKAVIHDKVKGQPRSIKESAQGEASSKKPSDAKTRNGHETFQCNDLRKDCVSQDPNDVDSGPSSRLKNTCPAGGASNILQYQMTSVESPVHSSPLNDGIHLDLETVNSGTRGGIENGYIDDLGISPVYETIGVPKVQAVSLKETPPSDNGDSGTHNNADDCESLEDVNAALHYLDSLYTEGSTGFQSNDDMDNSVPGSPRSIDSDVTTFGRRSSATYDVTVADGQEASCDKESVVSDNDRCSPSDNMGSSLSDNKGCSPESGDNRVSSPHSVGGTEGDLRRHTPPVFVPPPPPSNSPPPEEQNGVEGETEGFHEEIQEDPIPETADMVMMPDIVIVEPSENVTHSGMQNGDISDTVGDMSPYQDSDHSPPSSDMMKDTVSRTLLYNDDDASLDECDCDTGSAGGQFAVPGHTDFLDNADPPVIVLLDKTHRSLGISISGGRDSRSQPQVKIQKVFPGGAADIEGTIQSDMTLLTVDGHSLDDVCHQEAVTIIRRSYMDKKNPILKLVLLKD